ncbi:PREDICTED: putative uncharacterized protein C19orf35 homolog [Elephantulus edwardii]|uniref:putative uncharacterized protein C19orf35 homolog n=1 Tax=Elephantulus edwardii TaxID=28737 RepID=UPI0003F0ABED|nr:PREDICTED: putative uncharacterized protein C19orf35 homolog [Elephantulus edwardii]
MSGPEPSAEEPSVPTWPAQPTYSNLGEIRAHLQPSKAGRPRTSGSFSADPQPPPLPKKTLTRTQSLPTHRPSVPSPTHARPLRRPLLTSHSVDKSQEASVEARPAATELTFRTADAELGHLFHDLHSPEAVHASLAARQLATLGTVHARLHARLTGGRPGPCRPGHSFRLLDSSPYVDSGDALYYRVVRVDEDAWHILAAKVPKPEAEAPSAWGLELQASLPPHFNLQGLCGLVPERALPAAPWWSPVTLVAEVPERTVAQWLAEAGARQSPDFARTAALLLVQLSAALELLEARGAALAQLRPENLLLAMPRGCVATGLPRLLLADFWLRVRRALLTLHLAERAAGGEAPGLEDWLCCEYLAEASESALAGALTLLWN